MIPVTQPFLPPKEEYQKLVDGIWKRQWLTNMGPLASQLEMELKDHLEELLQYRWPSRLLNFQGRLSLHRFPS